MKFKLAAVVLWTPIFLLFFWPLLQGHGFYYGDYKQQFYPWSMALYGYTRHFSLPLWVSEIGCGFPLLAEGQVGALYPLSWLLYLALPFEWAYNLTFPVLFILSAFFFIFYCRKNDIGLMPASLGAVSFLFGSAYAGMFFGLAALRTAVFFAPMLYFTSRLSETASWKEGALLAGAVGLAFLGGYPQLALYMVLACTVYAFFAVRIKCFGMYSAALFFGITLAACQIIPTLELVRQSSRIISSLHFALQRSVNPAAFFGLFWPGFGVFTGTDFYIGFLPLSLAFFAMVYGRKEKYVVFFTWFFIIFLFISFGSFNPLYVAFLKLTRLYCFRTPSKFLFFSIFALSWLSAFGLMTALKSGEDWRRYTRTAFFLFIFSGASFAAAHFAVRLGGQTILEWAENFVRQEVYGRAGHPYSLQAYLSRLPQSLEYLTQRTSFHDKLFLGGVILQATSLTAVFIGGLFYAKKRKLLAGLVILLTVFDLYLYSSIGSGFIGNCVRSDAVKADSAVEFLSERKGDGRVYEMSTEPSRTPRWLPNSNMLFGYSSIGVYSPLAVDSYREYLKNLGDVDNASGAYFPVVDTVLKNKAVLRMLNVRYILTKDDLNDADFTKIDTPGSEDKVYALSGTRPRAFLLEGGEVVVSKLADGCAIFKTNVIQPTHLFWSELYYPGWEARIDGQKIVISAEDVFQKVAVPAGAHEVRFDYRPMSFRLGCVISMLALLGLAFMWRRS